jgi:hypothetical protein
LSIQAGWLYDGKALYVTIWLMGCFFASPRPTSILGGSGYGIGGLTFAAPPETAGAAVAAEVAPDGADVAAGAGGADDGAQAASTAPALLKTLNFNTFRRVSFFILNLSYSSLFLSSGTMPVGSTLDPTNLSQVGEAPSERQASW